MKINKVLSAVLLLISFSIMGQNSGQKLIRGEVYADSVMVQGINIVNLVTKQATVTDAAGKFSIYASADDLLVLTAVQFEVARYSIEEDDMAKALIRIKMVPKITALDETVVKQYSHINAEAMGIIPEGQKKYTPAERRLAAAQSGPVDILLNMFSGKTEMRQKEIAIERKEYLLERLTFLYPDSFYTEKLKIPKAHIQAFKYYVVEDSDFAATVINKDKIVGAFILGKLAGQYLNLLANEN